MGKKKINFFSCRVEGRLCSGSTECVCARVRERGREIDIFICLLVCRF